MSVPFRTFLLLGVAVGMLGVGYLFAPQPGAMTLPTASPAPVAKAAAAAPVSKPDTTLVASRPPVPLVTRAHTTFFGPKEPQTAGPGITTGSPPTAEVQTASVIIGAPAADTAPAASATPAVAEAKAVDDGKARAAVELDGYKNVRGLVKGDDGVWRGRAMRGRTEIAISVDATGSVSAE